MHSYVIENVDIILCEKSGCLRFEINVSPSSTPCKDRGGCNKLEGEKREREREREVGSERESELERGYNIIVLGEQGPQTARGPRREINALAYQWPDTSALKVPHPPNSVGLSLLYFVNLT